ncbi:MAG: alpha/beta hydrolase, partial [Acidobacteria bacterium]|nr:alpha/beta hydrolase [Acidobacteriota bacterium]
AETQKVVLHFHGGLVKKAKALAKAEELTPVYQAAGAHPVFFVWESGLLETLSHNLHEISKEKIFKILVKKVLKHAAGKLFDTGPAKSATGVLQLPTDIEVAVELQKLEAGEEPYGHLKAPADLDDLTDPQEERFESELSADSQFSKEVEAIVAAAHPEQIETTAKGVTAVDRKSGRTLMSPEVIDELVEDRSQAEAAGAKGVLSTAKLVLKAGKILFRVVRRMRKGRGHGLYVTVVEEILRELYIANVGSEVWGMMKKETADTFENAGKDPKRGGWLFVEELGRLSQQGHRPEITLVGHSTGAVFICHLLAHVAAARQDPDHPLPADFTFKNVVFLAPAVSCALFADTLDKYAKLMDSFRMFTMTDANESDDTLVKVIYPRSLLYFVSGVVERETNGAGTFDLPLVGMERYFTDAGTYSMAEVATVRDYVQAKDTRAVWSDEDRGEGLASNSFSHSDFDEIGQNPDGSERTTMKSVQHIIAQGA